MNRRVYLAAVGSAASTGLAGCSAVSSAFSEDDGCDGCDIGMTRNAFTPDEYEVSVGETVVWKNTSDADHTITARESSLPDGADYFATGGFEDEATAVDAWHAERGGRLGIRETFEHTFDVVGTYRYFCEPHINAGMAGRIVVSE
ncbi:cupredoxin domain-containing protein [Haloterrigena alkaliphila]|uniref:Halocyanin n=1 Tax=Haloterrigena alkaliphila TaxID=2816475 RepID=A0A8A2VE73_9EURY|nr:plastocyanin/azurin family copper-binding protein [Haloterrigena alkaliphila]QSW98575.1 plastocyanin/azurin family copper-binding protein [Haloterrigena alkaliphila]